LILGNGSELGLQEEKFPSFDKIDLKSYRQTNGIFGNANVEQEPMAACYFEPRIMTFQEVGVLISSRSSLICRGRERERKFSGVFKYWRNTCRFLFEYLCSPIYKQ